MQQLMKLKSALEALKNSGYMTNPVFNLYSFFRLLTTWTRGFNLYSFDATPTIKKSSDEMS